MTQVEWLLDRYVGLGEDAYRYVPEAATPPLGPVMRNLAPDNRDYVLSDDPEWTEYEARAAAPLEGCRPTLYPQPH